MAKSTKGEKGKDKNNTNNKVDIIRPIFDPDAIEANYSYKDVLKEFLLNKPVVNIALEGDFATGKSSVLYALLKDRCIKKKKPKLISSLTLDYGNQQNENEDKRQEKILVIRRKTYRQTIRALLLLKQNLRITKIL